MKNKCLLLSTFCTFQTPLTLLTYSAVINSKMLHQAKHHELSLHLTSTSVIGNLQCDHTYDMTFSKSLRDFSNPFNIAETFLLNSLATHLFNNIYSIQIRFRCL